MNNTVIKLRDISKKRGQTEILNHLNMTVYQKDIYGFIGQNGAGKSTTMKIIMSLIKETQGQLELFDTLDNQINRSRIGAIIENPAFYPYMTAYENLKYYIQYKGIVEINSIEKVLKMVGLENARKKKYKNYSLGMKQRLGIAQAMLNNPKILILDEPTAGLDPKERVKFRNLISSFSQDKIVILSTHIVSDIEFIADEIIVMKAGKKILTGTPEELLQDLRGSVWKCVAYDKKEVEMLNHKYCIINIHQENNTTELRIVSRQKPTVNAVNIEPNLEDLYLAYFQDNEK